MMKCVLYGTISVNMVRGLNNGETFAKRASYRFAMRERALHFMKHAKRHGGNLWQWLQLWRRTKHVEPSGRAYHEFKGLCDSLHFAGTHDQLNIPALISMEVLCRRVQSMVEAYVNPSRPSWEHDKVFQGQGTPEDSVSPVFRNNVVKKNKEELELLQARQKVRELRGHPAIAIEEIGGETGEGQPNKPTRGPKKGRGCGQENAGAFEKGACGSQSIRSHCLGDPQ